ncbi:DUF6896 domain-containing protein [Winogradskyella eximia]|uniref:DUF6896 domain-containing protein n=1 Tax=Winogradskyella eximia TaxID=262006 RepID=UPI00248FD8B7|nr:hypothetical protein [Winogradskyella eximia]
MNKNLNIFDLISDYQNSAKEVVDIFKLKFEVDDILHGWHTGVYEQTGNLIEEGLKFYAFHGIGIAVHFEDKNGDFDFAYMPQLRHDGFDLGRLTYFMKSQPNKYNEFLNEELLESEFERLKKEKLIYNPITECITHLYFWTKDLNENQMNNDQSISTFKIKSWWKFW